MQSKLVLAALSILTLGLLPAACTTDQAMTRCGSCKSRPVHQCVRSLDFCVPEPLFLSAVAQTSNGQWHLSGLAMVNGPVAYSLMPDSCDAMHVSLPVELTTTSFIVTATSYFDTGTGVAFGFAREDLQAGIQSATVATATKDGIVLRQASEFLPTTRLVGARAGNIWVNHNQNVEVLNSDLEVVSTKKIPAGHTVLHVLEAESEVHILLHSYLDGGKVARWDYLAAGEHLTTLSSGETVSRCWQAVEHATAGVQVVCGRGLDGPLLLLPTKLTTANTQLKLLFSNSTNLGRDLAAAAVDNVYLVVVPNAGQVGATHADKDVSLLRFAWFDGTGQRIREVDLTVDTFGGQGVAPSYLTSGQFGRSTATPFAVYAGPIGPLAQYLKAPAAAAASIDLKCLGEIERAQ